MIAEIVAWSLVGVGAAAAFTGFVWERFRRAPIEHDDVPALCMLASLICLVGAVATVVVSMEVGHG